MNCFDQEAASWDDKPARVQLARGVGEAIMREAAPKSDMTVLDYGCGTGLLGLYLLPHVAGVTGADNSSGMLEVLQGKIVRGGLEHMKTLRLDLEHDPVPGDRYDLIVTSMTLHHLADVEKTLRGFRRLLRPRGTLCLADLDTEPGTFHTAAAAVSVHHHGFDRQKLKKLLTKVGFATAKDTTAVSFTKSVEVGGEAAFSIFLITAQRGDGG
jgi:ubiquinone/menaquinone biosynthesis C-methylase UbiE